MKKPTKYVPVRVIQCHTSLGWEDVSSYGPGDGASRRDVLADLREYRASNTGAHRLIRRRVLRAAYETGNF